MAEAQHTPGEWTPRGGNSSGMEVVGKKPRGGDYIIARCGGKDREANANLIAAAPDMLAALREAERILSGLEIDEDCHFTADIRAAIAKAEGRTNA